VKSFIVNKKTLCLDFITDISISVPPVGIQEEYTGNITKLIVINIQKVQL